MRAKEIDDIPRLGDWTTAVSIVSLFTADYYCRSCCYLTSVCIKEINGEEVALALGVRPPSDLAAGCDARFDGPLIRIRVHALDRYDVHVGGVFQDGLFVRFSLVPAAAGGGE